MEDANPATPAATEAISRSPWILLLIPGAVGLYALVGAMWHPLLVGINDGNPGCERRPWDFVVLGSWLAGLILLPVAIAVAQRARRRTGLAIAMTGILLIAAGILVFAVAASHDYHQCDS